MYKRQGEDFKVVGVTVTGAVRLEDDEDTEDVNEATMVELTVTTLEPDAKPLVSVIGKVADRAGNEVDTDNDSDSQVTANDGVAATIDSITIDTFLAVKDDEVGISLAFNERLATEGVAVTVAGGDAANSHADLDTTRPTLSLIHI